jgi:ABC-2 type transport system permease protein
MVADSIAEMPPNVVRLLALEDDDLIGGYTAVLVTFAGLAVGAYAVSSVLRLRGEEQSGRTEHALSAPVSRRRWLASALGFTALAATGLLTLAGAALGLTAALATGRWQWLPRLTGASLAVLPAVLVLVGLAAALYGLRSSAAVLAWAVVAYTVGVGLFGGLLDLPGWVLDLSPFHVLPRLPAEPVSWAALLGLTGVGLVLALVGDRLFRRRDLTAG